MIQVAYFKIWNIEGMIPRTRYEEKCEEMLIHFNFALLVKYLLCIVLLA